MNAIIRARAPQIIIPNQGVMARDGLLPFEDKLRCDDWSPLKYGLKTLLWLRDSREYTLNRIGKWKSRGPGIPYQQLVQAKRPTSTGGAATFVRASSQILSSVAATIVTPAAWEAWTDFQLTVLPGAGTFYCHWESVQGAVFSSELLLNALGGYQPYSWIAQRNGGFGVGIADALDLNRHVIGISYNNAGVNNPANYLAWLDYVAKATVASGAHGEPGPRNSIGGRFGGGAYSDTTIYQYVIFSRQLSAGERVRLQDWFTNATPANNPLSIAYDGGNIADLVTWLPPDWGQSGNVTKWTDLSLFKRVFNQAVLAQEPYFELDDTVGDLKSSMVGSTSLMVHGDIAEIAGAPGLLAGFWMRGGVPIGDRVLIGQIDAGAVDTGFYIAHKAATGQIEMFIDIAGVNYVRFPAVGATWTRVDFAFDGSLVGNTNRIKCYFNGVQQVSTANGGVIPATIRNSASNFVLFGYEAGLYWPGRLDDITVIKKTPTPHDILKLATYYTRSG